MKKPVRVNPVQRYVKKPGLNRVIPVDTAGVLLERIGKDMFECDKDGRPIDTNPVEQARASRIEGSPQQMPVVPPRTAETNTARLAPEPAKSDAQLAKDEAEKQKLIKYAKDRHGVDIDPGDGLDLVKARVKKLNAKAGIPDKPQKRVRKAVKAEPVTVPE